MNESCADILFALYIHGGEGAMGWLAGLSSEKDEADIRREILLMVSAGLVTVQMKDDMAYAALTATGTQVALDAADLISGYMLGTWWQPAA